MKILRKYHVGQVIQEYDESIIEELANLGMIHIGISLNQRKITAKTTYLGRLFNEG